MPNQEKIKVVDNLTEKIKKASALYFAKYTGMNVEQATVLRQSFSDSSVEFLVSKNTLTKIAVGNAGLDAEKFGEFLNGQIAIAYANDDPTAPARVIKNFSKENECLQVVGLYFPETSGYKSIIRTKRCNSKKAELHSLGWEALGCLEAF